MNLSELEVTKTALRKQLHEYESITPSCTNCLKFYDGECSKFEARPPDEWVKGPIECEHWDYDNVPF